MHSFEKKSLFFDTRGLSIALHLGDTTGQNLLTSLYSSLYKTLVGKKR